MFSGFTILGGFESQDNITASAAFIPENLLPSSVNFVFFLGNENNWFIIM